MRARRVSLFLVASLAGLSALVAIAQGRSSRDPFEGRVFADSGETSGTVPIPALCPNEGEAATVTFCAVGEVIPFNWSVTGNWILEDGNGNVSLVPLSIPVEPGPTPSCIEASFSYEYGCDNPVHQDLVGLQWNSSTPVDSQLSGNSCTGCVPDGFYDHGPPISANCPIQPLTRQFHVVLSFASDADAVAALLGVGCPDATLPGADVPCPGSTSVSPCGSPLASPVLVQTSAGEIPARGWRSRDTPNEFHFVVDGPTTGVTGYRVATRLFLNGEEHNLNSTRQSHCETLGTFTLNIRPRFFNFASVNDMQVPWQPKASNANQNPCPNGNGQWGFNTSFDYAGESTTIDMSQCGEITQGSHLEPWKVRYRCRQLEEPFFQHCDQPLRRDYRHLMTYATVSAGQAIQRISANAFDQQECGNSPIRKVDGQCFPITCSPCTGPITPIHQPSGPVSGDAIIRHIPGCG